MMNGAVLEGASKVGASGKGDGVLQVPADQMAHRDMVLLRNDLHKAVQNSSTPTAEKAQRWG